MVFNCFCLQEFSRALLFVCFVCFFLFILITVLCINVVFVCCCLVFHTYGKHSVSFCFCLSLLAVFCCLRSPRFARIITSPYVRVKKYIFLYSFVVCVYTSINRASLSVDAHGLRPFFGCLWVFFSSFSIKNLYISRVTKVVRECCLLDVMQSCFCVCELTF